MIGDLPPNSSFREDFFGVPHLETHPNLTATSSKSACSTPHGCTKVHSTRVLKCSVPSHWNQSRKPAKSRLLRLESPLRIRPPTKQKWTVSNPFSSYQLDGF